MRKHDDAHRPLQGRGQRGNRPGRPLNFGGAVLMEQRICGALGGRCEWPSRCEDLSRCAYTAGVRGESWAR